MSHAIALQLDNPAIQLSKDGESTRYVLHVEQGEIKIDIDLSAITFEALVRQWQTLIPSPNFELTPPEVAASWRESAWPLKRLSDRSWQLLLREIQSEQLLFVLWYLKDVDIAQAVLRNMSLRLAAMTADDLIAKFDGCNPDNVPQKDSRVRGACESLKEILAVLNRLVYEGQIEEDFS